MRILILSTKWNQITIKIFEIRKILSGKRNTIAQSKKKNGRVCDK